MQTSGGAPPGGDEQRPLRRDAVANRERVLAAALAAIRREGSHVPMATIAAEAGVGIGTLYRRYPDREALLDALTHRSFELVLSCARDAEGRDEPAIASLDWYLDRIIAVRRELFMPLSGGPPLTGPTAAVRSQLHESLRRILARGRRDGSIRPDATTADVVIFGALLVAELPVADWGRMARRQKRVWLDGLSRPGSAGPPGAG